MNTMKWMTVAVLAAGVGCGSLTKDQPKDEFEDVTFELRNAGNSSIWIGVEFPLKLTVDGAEYTPLESCACRECPERADAFASPARTEIRPGEAFTHVWNGAVLGDDCADLRSMEGEEVTAEFCWGKNIAGPDEFIDGATDIECATETFVLGELGLVSTEVDSTIEYQDELLPIVIENATDLPIHLQVADNCGESTFFTVLFDGEELGRGSICGMCDCSEGPDCMVGCAAACEAPRVASVPAGASYEGSIARTYRKVYDESGYQCTQHQLVPDGALTASICWGTGIDEELGGEYGTISGKSCQDVEFEIKDDEVRFVVSDATTP